jgi:hypothetical protein
MRKESGEQAGHLVQLWPRENIVTEQSRLGCFSMPEQIFTSLEFVWIAGDILAALIFWGSCQLSHAQSGPYLARSYPSRSSYAG